MKLGCTSLVQPLDVGYNAEFKKEVAVQFQKFVRDNFEKWTLGKFTAAERRILITQWVGAAVANVNKNAPIQYLFEKCGLALPIDGSLDHQMNIQGLEDYMIGDWNSTNIEEDDNSAEMDCIEIVDIGTGGDIVRINRETVKGGNVGSSIYPNTTNSEDEYATECDNKNGNTDDENESEDKNENDVDNRSSEDEPLHVIRRKN